MKTAFHYFDLVTVKLNFILFFILFSSRVFPEVKKFQQEVTWGEDLLLLFLSSPFHQTCCFLFYSIRSAASPWCSECGREVGSITIISTNWWKDSGWNFYRAEWRVSCEDQLWTRIGTLIQSHCKPCDKLLLLSRKSIIWWSGLRIKQQLSHSDIENNSGSWEDQCSS